MNTALFKSETIKLITQRRPNSKLEQFSCHYPMTADKQSEQPKPHTSYSEPVMLMSSTICGEEGRQLKSGLLDKIKELRGISDERRKAIKGIQLYYTDKRILGGSFESNWSIHLDDYEGICARWDVDDVDKVSFFRFSLENESDTRQFHDALEHRSKQINQ